MFDELVHVRTVCKISSPVRVWLVSMINAHKWQIAKDISLMRLDLDAMLRTNSLRGRSIVVS